MGANLQTIRAATLTVQGERDDFGNRDDFAAYALPAQVRIHWLADGDHGFKPRKASGRTKHENWQEGVEAIVRYPGGASSVG